MTAHPKPLKDKAATGASTGFGRALISDVLLWLLLGSLAVFAVYFFAVRVPARRDQHITLYFRDANEISRGSAVHMMGIDVGYVDRVRILPDKVAVTIRTYPGMPPIPKDALFTILFTGLAGSKSIEIELPDKSSGNAEQCYTHYRVEEPIRLKHLLSANIEITQALQGGAENIADFFGKQKPVEELQFNIHQANGWSQDTLDFVTTLSGQVDAMSASIAGSGREAIDTLDAMNRGLHWAVVRTRPEALRPRVEQALDGVRFYGQLLAVDGADPAGRSPLKQRIVAFNAGNRRLAAWLDRVDHQVADFRLGRWLMGFEAGLDGFDGFLDRADAMLPDDPVASLQQFRQHVGRFNRQVVGWDQKLAAAHGQQVAPSSAKVEKHPQPPEQSIAIVDRNGQPLTTMKNRWWEQSPASAATAAGDESSAESLPVTPAAAPGQRFFLTRWLHTLWDAVCWLFH